MPVQIYPMFETALRAASGRSVDDHREHLGELWSGLSQVAARNPFAWIQEAKTAAEITTVSDTNRMIGLPYPKLMNSNNDVDMAAAVIMCSVDAARRLGIAEDRWVFPHAGTDCHEHNYVSHRDAFTRDTSDRDRRESCPRTGRRGHRRHRARRPVLVLPGGGPARRPVAGPRPVASVVPHGRTHLRRRAGNNYVMHAIATMVTELREQPGEFGLVWANGGYATKHAFGVYSTAPPAGFRHAKPQDEIDALPRRELAEPAAAAGPATIEAYTVMFSREAEPEQALAACRLADGRRAWATSLHADTAGRCATANGSMRR
jgi:acetyl-CoA C-acetyltransferase